MRLRIFPTASIMHLHSAALVLLRHPIHVGTPRSSTSVRDRNSKTMSNFNCLQHFRRTISLHTCPTSVPTYVCSSTSSCSSCLVVGGRTSETLHLKHFLDAISYLMSYPNSYSYSYSCPMREIFFPKYTYRIFCSNVQFNLSNGDTIWSARN